MVNTRRQARLHRQASPALVVQVDNHGQEPPNPVLPPIQPAQAAAATVSTNDPAIITQGPSMNMFGPYHRIIATYTGQNEAVHVDAWLNIYELVMSEKQDHEKKNLIVRFLDGDALTWFAHHVIMLLPSLEWKAVRELFIKRFKTVTVRPLIAASERYLKRDDTITTYFNDKMRFLQQTDLPDLDQVAILNKGMPWNYKPHLISSTIRSPSDWLMVALELESTFKKTKVLTPFELRNKDQRGPPKPAIAAQASRADQRNSERPIPQCRICQKMGIEAKHWHANCPNKRPRQQDLHSETANVSENM